MKNEYGKNSSNEGAKARFFVWVLQGKNIFPKQVIPGLSDGTYTEVAGGLNEGDLVVTGINQQKESSTTAQHNPFVPKFPSRR
jgi:hypothetical protein